MYPTTYHMMDRMTMPAQHCIRIEIELRDRSRPASKKARPGVMSRTKAVATSIQACSVLFGPVSVMAIAGWPAAAELAWQWCMVGGQQRCARVTPRVTHRVAGVDRELACGDGVGGPKIQHSSRSVRHLCGRWLIGGAWRWKWCGRSAR